MKLVKSVALAVAAVALSASAFAGNVKSQGVYVDGNVGYGKVNWDFAGTTNHKDSGFAWNINAGYQFNQNLALEADYLDFANGHVTDPLFGRINLKKQYAYGVAVKGILPMDNGFSVFAKAGAARVHSELAQTGTAAVASDSETTFLYGVGASYAINQNLAAQVQFAGTTKNNPLPAMYQGTVGLAYHF